MKRIYKVKGGLTAALLAASLISIPAAMAANYKIGNFDIHGSRSIPSILEPNLTPANVKSKGLEVKWFSHTDKPIAGVPIVYKGVVYVGTVDLAGGTTGSIYAFNANTGAEIWRTSIPKGVLASALIYKGNLYVAGFGGTLFKINRNTGAILKSYTPALSNLDSIWTGPLPVFNGEKDLIVMSINPGDESAAGDFGKAGVVAVDADTLQPEWTRVITANGEGGSGIWGTSPAYSIRHGLIYVGTGQTTKTSNLPTLPKTSDAIYALKVKDGSVAWKTQVQKNDIWSFSTPFDPKNPRDTDFGDSPALFTQGLKQYVAMGSKRGYFYVMDAKTGEITNKKIVSGSDTDSLGYKRALDAYNYSGTGVVGNSVDGGYNLDSGFYRKGLEVIHFSILFDYKAALKPVANGVAPWHNRTCFIAGYGFSPECPSVSSGNLIINSGDGSKELGRYAKANAKLFSPLYMNDLIVTVSTNNESSNPANQTPISVAAFDVSNPAKPKLIQDLPLSFHNISAKSGGSMLSVSNGMIYVGNGFLGDGPQSGLFAVGLKDHQCQNVDEDDDDNGIHSLD